MSMVDTVVLTLTQDMFRIIDHGRFVPSTKTLFDSSYGLGGRGHVPHKQNPTPHELKNGIYKPRLTATERINNGRYQVMLKVEFSAPKLLFGNNFDELQEKDFDSLVSILQQKLTEMAVLVNNDSLSNALVSSIHYSKNIKLTDGLTPYSLLKEIQKCNVTQRLDFNQTDYRNEGHSIKYHANSYEVAFYDKLKDMEQAKISESRAVEDDNQLQMSLFDELNHSRRKKPFELLRMEARLNQRQKIRQILRIIEAIAEPTFSNLFKRTIAQKVLLYYLNQLEATYPKTLLFKPKSAKDFLAQFRIDNPRATLTQMAAAYGVHKALEELSSRELRKMVSRYQTRSLHRLMGRLNSYSYPKNTFSPFEIIKADINRFEALRTIDFAENMLNNDNCYRI